ncbi:YbaK/EbsC family protein [Desulfocurvus sp. DL9XJH121]
MSVESVKHYLAENAPDLEVVEFDASTATVPLAAKALGVAEGQIAKTLSMRLGDDVIILVTRGDARLDNRKYKQQFGAKAKMLEASEVEDRTGHPVGGVCPFGLKEPFAIYCDESLKDFQEVFPAGGAPNAAVRIETLRLAELADATWVDVVQNEHPQTKEQP